MRWSASLAKSSAADFTFWLDTTRDDACKVTAIQVRDRGNGWLVATFPVFETTTAQELLVAIQRLRLTE
jgi:hypothetical protein